MLLTVRMPGPACRAGTQRAVVEDRITIAVLSAGDNCAGPLERPVAIDIEVIRAERAVHLESAVIDDLIARVERAAHHQTAVVVANSGQQRAVHHQTAVVISIVLDGIGRAVENQGARTVVVEILPGNVAVHLERVAGGNVRPPVHCPRSCRRSRRYRPRW